MLYRDRSLDSLVGVKSLLRRHDPSPLAAVDNLPKERSDVAVAAKVSLADRSAKSVIVNL